MQRFVLLSRALFVLMACFTHFLYAQDQCAVVGWASENGVVSGGGTTTATVVTTDSDLKVANFLPAYTLTTTTSPTGEGTINGAGTYKSGTIMTLTATPASGYIFTGWSGGASGTSTSITVTMNSNQSVTGNFQAQITAPTKYTLSTTAMPGGGGTILGGGTYNEGTAVMVTVTPATGYTFTGWSGDITNTSPSVTITMNSNKSIAANFQTQNNIGVIVRPEKLFSPDNGGNVGAEKWVIENAHLLDGCEIGIYNRQGQKVYSSIGYPTPWDGTVDGKQLPDGAYFYIIRYTDNQKQTGSVTIARLK